MHTFFREIPRVVGQISREEALAALEQFRILATSYPSGGGQTDRAPFWVRGVGRTTGKSTMRTDTPSWKYGQNPGTWLIHIRDDGHGNVTASASTDVPYARFLVSTQDQAGHMAGIGWRTAEDVLNQLGYSEANPSSFLDAFVRRLRSMLKGSS